MTDRSSRHASFIITREFAAPPALVFAAWADNKAKVHWFTGPGDWKQIRRELDFRVGGKERLMGQFPNGRKTDFDAHYDDIVTDERLVYTYTMRLNDVPISVSLATVVFKPSAKGTQMIFTEQAVFLDGYDDPDGRDRKRGTDAHFERLDAFLKKVPAHS